VKHFIALGASCLLVACSLAHVPPRNRFVDSELVTCHRVRSTGSHLTKVVCISKAEEAERIREAREYLDEEIRVRAAQEAARNVAMRERFGQ